MLWSLSLSLGRYSSQNTRLHVFVNRILYSLISFCFCDKCLVTIRGATPCGIASPHSHAGWQLCWILSFYSYPILCCSVVSLLFHKRKHMRKFPLLKDKICLMTHCFQSCSYHICLTKTAFKMPFHLSACLSLSIKPNRKLTPSSSQMTLYFG